MTNYDPEIYGKMLIETLPAIIETEEENEKALAIVERIMDKGEENISPEEGRLMQLLAFLIEDFEDKAYPMGGKVKPVDHLRALMFEHKLKQNDLAEIFGSQSVVSEVLNGKREISKRSAKRLGDRFNLPADLFI